MLIVLDVSARWRCTLLKIGRYLKLQIEVNSGTKNLNGDKEEFKKLSPGFSLMKNEANGLNWVVQLLQSAETATQLLGCDLTPIIHLRDVLFPSVVHRCREFEAISQPEYSLA